MLPSGEKSMAGVSINIPDVSRHHTGLYICTAENGVGHPSAAEIDLQVLCKYIMHVGLFSCILTIKPVVSRLSTKRVSAIFKVKNSNENFPF